jgi:alditol oxidase
MTDEHRKGSGARTRPRDGLGRAKTDPRVRANWAGNVVFRAARLHRPETVDALRRIVTGSTRLRALGSGHSFSGIVDTDGDLVLMDGLPHELRIDSADSTVTASAGMSYTVLSRELNEAGFALANLASIPDLSIAGACATGTHGSGDQHRVLAASVVAMQLVVSDGTLVELRRDADGETFLGSVVALGALGIVTQLTLEVEPAYEMSQRVHLGVRLDEIHDHFDEVFSAGDSVSAFTDWRSGEASVWVKRRVDRPASNWTAGRHAPHGVHPIPGMSPGLCTEQLGVVGPWHERLPHFRPRAAPGAGNELQSEVFLPRRVAQQAITALSEMGRLLAPALLVSEMRTVRGDELWLSPAYGRDSVAFHFTWTGNESVVLPIVSTIEERLLPLDPRPHWGKVSAMAPRTVISSYERAPDFARLLVERDPTSTFRNDFVNGLFPVP